MAVNSFRKDGRLCGSNYTDMLFSKGNRSIGVFPVRLVWLTVPASDFKGVKVLVSAPKRHFKHAVDRNRTKRQIREFYRTSSEQVRMAADKLGVGLALGIIFTDDRLWATSDLVPRLKLSFDKLANQLEQLTPSSL